MSFAKRLLITAMAICAIDLVFILLKVTGVIRWDWFFVVLPAFVPFAIAVVMMLCALWICFVEWLSGNDDGF